MTANAAPPTFSIVTPVFNRADVISRCIESVSSQECGSFEHLIVDDGSTDATAATVLRHAAHDRRIRLFTSPVNQGVNRSRNIAIRQAVGTFTLFLDSDDALLPGALSIIDRTTRDKPEFQHYLFVPDDQQRRHQAHPILKHQAYVLTFADWIQGRVDGDFLHVIRTPLLQMHPFSERFRIYEILDFIRLYKAGSCQYYSHVVTTSRDRKRVDSVSREYHLDNKYSMEQFVDYVHALVDWFRAECPGLQSRFIAGEARKGIIVGAALGRRSDNGILLEFLREQGQSTPIVTLLSNVFPARVVAKGIIMKSRLNRLLDRNGNRHV